MALLTLDKVYLAYGMHALLDRVNLAIEPGEKIALVGRNGEGKSSLLKLLAGQVQADEGTLLRQDELIIRYLDQELPERNDQRVFDRVAEGLGEISGLLARHHALVHGTQDEGKQDDARATEQLLAVQQELESRDGWSLIQRTETVLSRLQLDPDARMSSLSGGWRRRVMLGRALVANPDLLLLDEPTNHLDIPAIAWLEQFVSQCAMTVIVVTHDRQFLHNTIDRVIELDRGRLYSVRGSYEQYLLARARRLEEESREQALFEKRLAAEEVWIRKGIEARRTRNEGRVRALEALRNEAMQRRKPGGNVSLTLESGERSGRLVLEARGLQYAWPDRAMVLSGFDFTLARGDRVGLVGPNGCGKTTLIKLLLGQLTPDAGTIRQGTRLQVAYFDQLREQLNPNLSVRDNLAAGNDFIEIGGRRIHVMSWLADFLFPPARCQTPVSALSGGERNRLLLARLFSQPANLLVMDEPTNDLDVETLELLEERLMQYDGSLLLVSHDRAFMDNVVTSILAFEDAGQIGEYAGGYSDWLRQGKGFAAATSGTTPPRRGPENGSGTDTAGGRDRAQDTSNSRQPAAKGAHSADGNLSGVSAKSKGTLSSRSRMSYKLRRELEMLPAHIEAVEAELSVLHAELAQPGFYEQEQAIVRDRLALLAQREGDLESAMERWSELEDMAARDAQ